MPDYNAVSIVMVSFHTGNVLWEAIASALEQSSVSEVRLVNNGNPKDVLKKLEQLADENSRFILLSGHGNVGFAAGCNIGARQARGEYLLFLNPDCLLSSGTVSFALDGLLSNNEAWMAGVRLAYLDGAEQAGGRRNLLTPKTAIVESFFLDRLPGIGEKFSPLNLHRQAEPKAKIFVPAISGAFMLISAKRFFALGGFDEKFFLHVEDLDLCLRINQLGGKILYLSEYSVLHQRSTSRVSSLKIEQYKRDSFIYYFKKHFYKNNQTGLEVLFSLLINLNFIIRIIMNFLWPLIGKIRNKIMQNRAA